MLPDKKIVVAIHRQLWIGNVAALSCLGAPTTIPEVAVRSELKFYGITSPGYGREATTQPARVFAQAQDQAYCFASSDLTTVWQADLPTSIAGDADNNSSPAVGPLADSARNLVYFSPDFGAQSEDERQFSVFFADGNSNQPSAWNAVLNRRYFDACSAPSGRTRLGSLGSPSIHDNGDVMIPSDDGALYPFDNVAGYTNATNNERWPLPVCDEEAPFSGDVADYQYYMSCTTGLTADHQMLFWTEDGRLCHGIDLGTSFDRNNEIDLQFDGWVFGAPVLDTTSRVYVATPGVVDDPTPDLKHGREVLSYAYSTTGLDAAFTWRYRPPQALTYGSPPQQVNLRRKSHSPLAMDEDGTLYVVNEGYILALRPLIGDFDGDGCRNNFDIDPFVEALLTPLVWDANYGAPIGINLLGIGDCNNDGTFDNFDIDCFVEFVECCNNCAELAGGGGDAPSAPSSESGAGPQWEYFYAQIDWLRQIYGMDAP